MPYISGQDRNQVMLCTMESFVPEHSIARVIDAFVEGLDMDALGFTKSQAAFEGRPSYDPRCLLKLYLYGQQHSIRSSRKLQEACSLNVEVRWLLGGLTPDFRTISDFRKDNIKALPKVFHEFNRKIISSIQTGFISIDGSKIQALNAKDRNFTANKLDDRISWLDAHCAEYLRQIKEADEQDDNLDKGTVSKEELERKLKEAQERLAKYQEYRKIMEDNGLSQLSLTDADAKLMKNKNGFAVAYNVQTAVDSESHLIRDFQKTIDKIISSYDISDNVASGSVSRISVDINTVTDRDMQTTQTNYTTNLNNLKSAYNTSTDAFSDDQKTLFKKLLRENNLYDENTSTRLKESSEKQKEEKETSQNGDSSADAESTDNITPVPSYPAFSGKYFAIGFILAVMLYIFCMVVFEMLRSRCSDVAGYLDNSRLGVFMDTTNKKSGFLFCDKLLMKVLYREQADLVNGIDRVLTKAQMNSIHDKLSDAEIWTVGFDTESVPLIESIKRAASEKSINVTVHSTSDGRPEAMISDIAPEKSVILVACDGVSRKKDISFLTEMLMTRKADYLGVVEII